MLMNYNDFKYIFKRVLIFIIISVILFCFNIIKAKANTDSIAISGHTGTFTETGLGEREWVSVNQNIFGGYKDGRVMFTLATSKAIELHEVYLDNNTGHMACTFGNNTGYSDSTTQYNTYSIECYADFTGDMLRRIHIIYYNHTNPSYIYIPQYISYYSYDTPKDLISAIQSTSSTSAIQALQQAQQQNTTAIINSINSQASQAHQDAQQAHQDSQNINNSINDTTPVSNSEISGNTNDWSNNNLTNGTITQLLTLPLTLIQAYLNGINSSCSTFNLGNLLGTDLILPCINISSYLGTGLWSTIDILFSGFMILNIGKKLIKIFNDFTNLNNNQADELYGGGA